MENLNTLLVVSLDCNPGKEHVSHLSKSKCSVWINENDFGWSNVYIPLSKVSAHQHQQINDI